MNGIQYQKGFGNYVQTAALEGALPTQQNSPLQVPYGLYAEQITGTPFTAPRGDNLHSWLYRILPAAVHSEFEPYPENALKVVMAKALPPTQLRWQPFPYSTNPTTFLTGLLPIAGSPLSDNRFGAMLYVYRISESMEDTYFYDADGELLFIPQEGQIELKTEFGILEIGPAEIAVVPRGVRFQVMVKGKARGYVCENFGIPFHLPELGIMGANALANPRHFQLPQAYFEDKSGHFHLIAKFSGHFWQASIDHSPLDVVAWHGNYTPYKYDLRYFNTLNTVSYDHPDPSIFTVLTSPSAIKGLANLDFVIFPKRWMVAEHTFRPPYFHRNTMSELMGLIYGQYDARSEGFLPGGISIHNCMIGHGPDAMTYEAAVKEIDQPATSNDSLAFLLESQHVWHPTEIAYHSHERDRDYLNCWKSLQRQFRTTPTGVG